MELVFKQYVLSGLKLALSTGTVMWLNACVFDDCCDLCAGREPALSRDSYFCRKCEQQLSSQLAKWKWIILCVNLISANSHVKVASPSLRQHDRVTMICDYCRIFIPPMFSTYHFDVGVVYGCNHMITCMHCMYVLRKRRYPHIKCLLIQHATLMYSLPDIAMNIISWFVEVCLIWRYE